MRSLIDRSGLCLLSVEILRHRDVIDPNLMDLRTLACRLLIGMLSPSVGRFDVDARFFRVAMRVPILIQR